MDEVAAFPVFVIERSMKSPGAAVRRHPMDRRCPRRTACDEGDQHINAVKRQLISSSMSAEGGSGFIPWITGEMRMKSRIAAAALALSPGSRAQPAGVVPAAMIPAKSGCQPSGRYSPVAGFCW
jgi:hypothetical protein